MVDGTRGAGSERTAFAGAEIAAGLRGTVQGSDTIAGLLFKLY